jgi:flagellar motor switch protein FliN/FliY
MAEDNTAEVIEEPEDRSSGPDQSRRSAGAGEVALDNDERVSAANETGSAFPDVSSSRSRNRDAGVSSPMDMATTDLSLILDIPVTLSMEIGQTRITINELLKLGKDSVIELQRMTDEPLDVLVNGTLVAHGEAVVVGDRFGIRLTDVISPQERLRKFS